MDAILAIWVPGIWECAIFGILVLLLFHARLPLLGRNIAKFFTELKAGVLGDGKTVTALSAPDRQTQPRPDPGNDAPAIRGSHDQA